ncbi:hypothetical protein F4808DRAFT_254201 [Astrocystis sublimbata]|nr:hypothetical protein F4808DRAFT_254183 [Astrocystis sublimbata]KAI0198691.1 hypothetical protein F4808DRAFT_254201 [Astrocystis sublimbata]
MVAISTVRSLHLPVTDHPAWRETPLEHMICRLPNLEDFHFDPVSEPIDKSLLPRQILATHTTQYDTLINGLGLTNSPPSTVHCHPSFSGKTWTKALAYHSRIREFYFDRPCQREMFGTYSLPDCGY